MKNSEYWKERFKQLEETQNKIGLDTYSEIERLYREAQRQLEGQITRWYQRLADNNGISMAEAKKMLTTAELKEFKWDVRDYIKAGKENAVDQRWLRQLENASARYHISRLEALKLQVQNSLETAFGNQLDQVDRMIRKAYTEGYYHTAFEIQKGLNIGWDIAGLDQAQIDKVIIKPWAADGKNFSERIWGNKNKLISEVHNELTRGIMLGEDPQKAINNIAKKMNTSKHNAGRLVMTEEAFFSSAAQKDCFKELDVEQFEIVATLDSHTSEICRELDGKHYPMSDFEPGVTAPPFHVYCRSTTVPYFDDDFGEVGERAARGADGKTYYVPADMTYRDWQKSFVDGGDKSGFDVVGDDAGVHYKKKNEEGTSEEKFDIKANTKKLKGAMKKEDYEEYIKRLIGNGNLPLQKIYADYADKITEIQYSANGGYYKPSENLLVYSYPKQQYLDNGRDKYSTLAHEYGHYFDRVVNHDNLNYNEINTLNSHIVIGDGSIKLFKQALSSSDEFLSALRKDKEILRAQLSNIKDDLLSTDASVGVQDAVSGMFIGAYGKEVRWGHKDEYYNRLYNNVKSFKRHNELKKAYKELGLDASSQAKVKSICRNYETASEMWANIMSAETCGGIELNYVKKYLPNAYQAFLEIIGKVE